MKPSASCPAFLTIAVHFFGRSVNYTPPVPAYKRRTVSGKQVWKSFERKRRLRSAPNERLALRMRTRRSTGGRRTRFRLFAILIGSLKDGESRCQATIQSKVIIHYTLYIFFIYSIYIKVRLNYRPAYPAHALHLPGRRPALGGGRRFQADAATSFAASS